MKKKFFSKYFIRRWIKVKGSVVTRRGPVWCNEILVIIKIYNQRTNFLGMSSWPTRSNA